jgi:benzoyl-CoA 2,3-dioxygenase component B
VIKRALETMNALGSDDPAAVRNAGAIDLPTLQRYINFWFSSSLDLFGAEISSNAATYFATGIKGRPTSRASGITVQRASTCGRSTRQQGRGDPEEVPMRNAMNEVTRAAYIRDCDIGVQRWNRLIQDAGRDFRLILPSPRFRRSVGAWAGTRTDPREIRSLSRCARPGTRLAALREDRALSGASWDGSWNRANSPAGSHRPMAA